MGTQVTPNPTEPKNSSSVAESLCAESVHSTLMKIFRPKSSEKPTSSFNPSGIAGKISHGQKKSLKLSRNQPGSVATPKVKDIKPVTVTFLYPDVYNLPKEKDKKKLRDEGRMSFCSFSKEDSADIVNQKISEAIPCLKDKKITFLQVTKNGDLFKVTNTDVDGNAVLSLIGTGGLYVTTIPANVKKVSSVQPLPCVLEKPKLAEHVHNSTPVVEVLVHPRQCGPPHLLVANKQQRFPSQGQFVAHDTIHEY